LIGLEHGFHGKFHHLISDRLTIDVNKASTVKAKDMISRALEEKANKKAKNNHAEKTIVAIMHGNYFCN